MVPLIELEHWPRIASLVAQTDPGVNIDIGTMNGLLGGALAVTGIGGPLAICLGAAGFGAILRSYLG